MRIIASWIVSSIRKDATCSSNCLLKRLWKDNALLAISQSGSSHGSADIRSIILGSIFALAVDNTALECII